MPFSYSAVWDDAVQTLRSHASLITAIAGVFIFLPSLLTSYLLPQPQGGEQQPLGELVAYLNANFHWLVLGQLVRMIGIIAILQLVFNRGVTVGGAIAGGVALLPFYFLASLLSGFLIGLGFILLILPGLYLFGRLAPLGVVVVAENRRNPIDALRRTFALTSGRGWAILGLVLLVAIAGFVAVAATVAVLGSVFLLVLPRNLGDLLVMIVSAFAGSVFEVVLLLLYAAIYRALAPAASVAARFN